MIHPAMTMLYVNDPTASAAYYAKLFEVPPVEASPTFAMFVLPNGFKLGLWSKHTVSPAATAPGGMELCFRVEDAAAVERHAAAWEAAGLVIALPFTRQDFGPSCVALDPDGHRLRVYAMED